MAKAEKVKFKHGTRMCRKFTLGTPVFVEKGTVENINRPVAEKWERMGLGKIVDDASPVELQGA